jgi:hypothetical protein
VVDEKEGEQVTAGERGGGSLCSTRLLLLTTAAPVAAVGCC